MSQAVKRIGFVLFPVVVLVVGAAVVTVQAYRHAGPSAPCGPAQGAAAPAGCDRTVAAENAGGESAVALGGGPGAAGPVTRVLELQVD